MAATGSSPNASRAGAATRSARLTGGELAVIGGVAILAIVFATGQILPPSSDHQAQVRAWLASRAAGITALVLMTFQVVVGLILSHPVNKSTWKLSKRLFPWHEHAWVFTLAFVAVHGVTMAADRFAHVGWLGALVPGMSEFRSVPIAIGTIAAYAMVITGITARVTRLLPTGWWLKLHRLSLVVLALAWAHGLLSGTDTFAAAALYATTFGAVAVAAAYRYWIVRAGRPTFATSLARESHR
jgi:sulfoxide reductase heme-binding subunit YedZ